MRALIVAPLFAACSSSPMTSDDQAPYNCAIETRADTFVVGLDKQGAAGKLDFKLMQADPAPPARDDNTWTVQISAMSGATVGQGVAGMSLSVTPFMPDHQHGTPIQVGITDKGGGTYELSPVNLWMPGLWQTTIQASGGSASDQAVFSFCIPE
jgi:hypothetical protein